MQFRVFSFPIRRRNEDFPPFVCTRSDENNSRVETLWLAMKNDISLLLCFCCGFRDVENFHAEYEAYELGWGLPDLVSCNPQFTSTVAEENFPLKATITYG